MVDGDTLPGGDAGEGQADAAAASDAARADGAAPDAGTVSIVFAGASTDLGASGSGTDLVVAVPDGTAAGDLLVAAVASNDDTTTDMYPTGSGWTELARDAELSGPSLGVWARYAEGAGQVDYYGFEVPSGSAGYVVLMRFTGQADDPIGARDVLGGQSQAAPCPSIDAGENSVALCLGAFDGPQSGGDTGLDGYQTIVMGGGTYVSAGAGYRSQWSAAATPAASFALAQSLRYRTMAVALRGN